MAQWDVYANPNPGSRVDVPYLVDVQSDLLHDVPTRLVIPLAPPRRRLSGLPQRMSPVFQLQGQQLLLLPQEAGPVAARALRKPVASLRSDAHRIIDALDAVVSGV
jgi:toxin CcdB